MIYFPLETKKRWRQQEEEQEEENNNLCNIFSVEVVTALASIDACSLRIHAIVPELEPSCNARASSLW